MVGKKKRGKNENLLGSHQRCWLWGRHAVLETLRAGRWRPIEVFWDPEIVHGDVQRELISYLESLDLPDEIRNAKELEKLCRAPDHQGLIARMPPFPYTNPNAVSEITAASANILILCGLQDPFNFGSILRSADLFGIRTILIPAAGQTPVSSHVVRSSVGAVNYLDVIRVDSLEESCHQLKRQGFRLIAADEKATQPPDQVDLKDSVALLVGNEAVGVPEVLLDLCDELVAIPQSGHVDSLNAAVAAGILCYEMQRQRLNP